MNVLIYIVSGFSILIIISLLFNFKLSIALYISFLILVPYPKIYIGTLVFPKILFDIIILIYFIIRYAISKSIIVNYDTVKPYCFLFFSLLFLSLFTDCLTPTYQLKKGFSTFVSVCAVPFVFWNSITNDNNILRYVKYSLIISLLIACVYGLYLTQHSGNNPYTMWFSSNYGFLDSTENYVDKDPRLSFLTTAKIQSTMGHPMVWTLNICLLLILFISILPKRPKAWNYLFLVLIGTNLVIASVRTGVAAITLGFIYYVIRSRKSKVIAIALLVLMVSYLVFTLNENINSYITSIGDGSSEKSNIIGSSIMRRLDQLQGAIDEVGGRYLLFGKGFCWNQYYIDNFSMHSDILYFESLIFMVMCNHGIVGLCVYILFFISIFVLNRRCLRSKQNIYWLDALLVTYIAYTSGTGDYGYMKYFYLYYSLMLALLMLKEKSLERGNVMDSSLSKCTT